MAPTSSSPICRTRRSSSTSVVLETRDAWSRRRAGDSGQHRLIGRLGTEPYAGVEYAVAKAGVVRLTTALGTVDGVRVNCICPHTVATEAVLRALETRPIDQIAPPPATVLSLAEVCAAVLRVIEDDSLAGRVLLLVGGEAPQFLSPRGG